MPNDVRWLILSYTYVALVIGIGTWVRIAGRRSPDLTRKIIHVGIGTWIIPTTLFFQSPWMALIPPASFILLNILSFRFKIVNAMEEGERNMGTIYFPLAFVILILLFWPHRAWGLSGDHPAGATFPRIPIAAGIMAMAWGDAAASLVGRHHGRRRFATPSGHKSMEGSAAFVFFCWLGIAAAALALGGGAWGLRAFIAPAILVSLAAAAAEALTPFGLDNLTVPVTASVMTRLLLTA